MSSGDNVELRYTDEAVIAWKELAYVDEDFADNISGEASDEIASHADANGFDYGSKKPAGGFNSLFREDTMDDFIAAFMGDDWTVGVIGTGKLRKSFKFEKEFTDMTGNKFIGFDGLEVDEWEFTVQFSESASDSKISNRFSFVGKTALGTYGATASVTPAAIDNTLKVFNARDVSLMQFNGGAICLSSITFKGSRSKEGLGCIGDDSPSIITVGSPRFEISFEGYFTDGSRAVYEESFASNNGSIDFTLATDTPTNYNFACGNCGILATTPVGAGKGSENMISGTLVPVHDNGTAAVVITKT